MPGGQGNVSRAAAPAAPAVKILEDRISLLGSWTIAHLGGNRPRALRATLAEAGRRVGATWGLGEIEAMDLAGALLIWQAWGERRPDRVELREEQAALLSRIEQSRQRPPEPPALRWSPLAGLAAGVRSAVDHGRAGIALIGQLVLDLAYLARHPRRFPWRELSATIFAAGARALKIIALVGVLIGVVVSYLSSIQLRQLGAQAYIVPVLGLSIVRELGPLLAAVLVAGRSGASMTAELGVMRVTQELDALSALGISRSIRLVFPKVAALVMVLPLLVVWTDFTALLGGMLSARQSLGVGFGQFLAALPTAVPVVNLGIGLLKSAVFGALIGLTACHYGFRIRPNTESLGTETTNAVVMSITQVILVDATFAVLFEGVGLE